MDTQKLNKTARLREWANMVYECRNSGMTASAWCEEHGISPKTYYNRLKRVSEEMPEVAQLSDLPPVQGESQPTFAEFMPAGRCGGRDAAITVRFENAEMQIHNGTEPEIIEATLRVLSSIC